MEYTITKVSGDINWDTIPSLAVEKVLWCEEPDIRAWGQFCFDEENLHVHLRAAENNIRAEYTKPLSPIHEDSCLEFFFRLSGSKNYFNFEINPNGCMCVQFGPERTDRIDIVRKDAADYFAVRTNRNPIGWDVFYRIPLKFIRLFYPDYVFSGELEANVYKCGDKTEKTHYLAWNPISLDTPNFHCPEFFGKFRFMQH